MTTSFGAAAQRPDSSVSGLNRGCEVSTPKPNVGEPEDHTLKEFTVPGFPKVYRLSNRVVDGKPIGAHNDGVVAVEC